MKFEREFVQGGTRVRHDRGVSYCSNRAYCFSLMSHQTLFPPHTNSRSLPFSRRRFIYIFLLPSSWRCLRGVAAVTPFPRSSLGRTSHGRISKRANTVPDRKEVPNAPSPVRRFMRVVITTRIFNFLTTDGVNSAAYERIYPLGLRGVRQTYRGHPRGSRVGRIVWQTRRVHPIESWTWQRKRKSHEWPANFRCSVETYTLLPFPLKPFKRPFNSFLSLERAQSRFHIQTIV